MPEPTIRSRWIPVAPDAFIPVASPEGRPSRFGAMELEEVPLQELARTPELDTARSPECEDELDTLDELLWTVDGPERQLLEDLLDETGREDEEIVLHSLRVGALAERIALEMGCPVERAEILRRASVLHDIGKLSIPEAILRKKGPLKDEEYETSKLHTVLGADLLEGGKLPVLKLAQELALRHHERWNGTGYPDGLRGEQTPIMARIVAVADVFDALTHERPYKMAWSADEAAAELARERGVLHEARIVDALFSVLDRYGVQVPRRGDRAA